MGLDDFEPIESSEWWWSPEVSEKFRDAVKKASAWRKRSKKDEWRAKKHDFLLAKFLVELILKKEYDDILNHLFICIDKWYWTNFLLWVMSFIYIPISDEIRKSSWNNQIVFDYTPKENRETFNDDELDEKLRIRINQWIEDMRNISLIEVSSIMTQKTLRLLGKDEDIIKFAWKVFQFFFNNVNIDIDDLKSEHYANFIIWELTKSLKRLNLNKV